MIPVQSLKEIENTESRRFPSRPTMVLFCRPDTGMSSEMCTQFRYIHEDSGSDCSIYPAGYLSSNGCGFNPFPKGYHARPMDDPGFPFPSWWYSDKCFVDLKRELELRMNKEYRGGFSIAVLSPGRGGVNGAFDYCNSILVNGESLVANKVVASPVELLQRLISSARADSDSRDVLKTARSLQKLNKLASLEEVARTPLSIVSLLLGLGEGVLAPFLI